MRGCCSRRLAPKGRFGQSQARGSSSLVLPEVLEPVRRKLRVAHSVRDVLVAQVLLDRPRVVTIVRKLVAACVAEHVRMDWKW